MKDKKLKRAIIFILGIIILCVLVIPIPIRINRSLPAIRGKVGEQGMNLSECTIEVRGTYYFSVLRPDQYIGTLSVSGIEATVENNAQLQTSFSNTVNPLIYHTDKGYIVAGVLCFSGFLEEMILGFPIDQNDHGVFAKGYSYVCAPATSVDEARGVIARLSSHDEYLSIIDW